VALEIASEYPDIRMNEMLVDNCAMQLVHAPEQFEVIVTTNLFGDILSDIASVLVGGLGVACSGNIGMENAVFEPVHGSAPDITGRNRANPTAALLSAARMLEHLGEGESATRLRSVVEMCLAGGKVTPNMGGSLTTREMTREVINELKIRAD